MVPPIYQHDYFADTAAHTGYNWNKITAMKDSVFSALTAANITGSLSSMELKAGQSIEGRFTGLTLSSGQVMCRRG